MQVDGYVFEADQIRRAADPLVYASILDANPRITLGTVQAAAETIAVAVCKRENITGVRWDENRGKYVFAAGSDAKVIKDRWAGGLRAALNRRLGNAKPNPMDLVTTAVRQALRAGVTRAEISRIVDQELRA